jgi:hypothetical protein
MQRGCGNDVSAVRRKGMWRRVRPTLAHTDSYHRCSLFAKVFVSQKRCEDAPHSKALRAKFNGDAGSVSRKLAKGRVRPTAKLWSARPRVAFGCLTCALNLFEMR